MPSLKCFIFLHEEFIGDGGPVHLVLRLLDEAPELCQPGVNTLDDVRLTPEITDHPLNLKEILRIVHTLNETVHALLEIKDVQLTLMYSWPSSPSEGKNSLWA